MKTSNSFNILIALVIAFVLLFVQANPSKVHATETGPRWLFVMIGQSGAGLLCPYLETSIVAYYGPNARLLCEAVPGSGMATWQPGQPNYVTAVQAVNKARLTDGYTLKAVLINNGEFDAWLAADANVFAARMTKFVDTFRIATGNRYTLVVYNQLGRKPSCAEQNYVGYPQWEKVRMQEHDFRYNRFNAKMVEQLPFTVDYQPGLPCAHLTPSNRQAVANQYMINLRGWVPLP